jgi:adenylate cyclase
VEREPVQRRLAAILAADVAGYSRLIGDDEEGTIARLRALRRELIDPAIAAHRGRIVKTTGDGILIEFPSAVDAVRCAVDVQQQMTAKDANQPQAKRIAFRVGIHIGDVVVEGDDLLGDGVNVAARLEGIAEPSGVYISEDVYRQIRDRVTSRFIDTGEQQLKNIARPMRVYRLADDLSIAPPGSGVALPLPDKPSIAVLPFQNMSGDLEQEYFTDGITEDIITALSKWRWFLVIARNSTFTYKGRVITSRQVGRELGVRYVLEGSVRRGANRVRITAQLVEAETSNHLWAEHFDRELSDIFAVQDEITERVVAAIEPELMRVEGERARRKRPGNMHAFDCFQRGFWHFNRFTEEDNSEARRLFRQAITLDPELAEAHTGLARSLVAPVMFGWSKDPTADLTEGLQAAQRALARDDKDPYLHYLISGASLVMGEHDKALDAAERAVTLNPNFALGFFRLGQVRVFSGFAEEALEPLFKGLRLNPYDPQRVGWLAMVAHVLYQLKRYEEAARYALQAVQADPRQGGTQLKRGSGTNNACAILAASYGQVGRVKDASQALEELNLVKDPVTESLFPYRMFRFASKPYLNHVLDGLRKAGLRE